MLHSFGLLCTLQGGDARAVLEQLNQTILSETTGALSLDKLTKRALCKCGGQVFTLHVDGSICTYSYLSYPCLP